MYINIYIKSKVSRKNRCKKTKIGAGPEYKNIPDIENQLNNVRYETVPDIENQLNKDIYENRDIYKNENIDKNIDIDKPKNIVEYVPLQKETSIEPMEEDIEWNIPSDERIDLEDSGYGVYDTQFYGGISKKRTLRMTSKTRRDKNKKSKTKRNKNKNKKSKTKRNKNKKSKTK
jgi:hypothetical protein